MGGCPKGWEPLRGLGASPAVGALLDISVPHTWGKPRDKELALILFPPSPTGAPNEAECPESPRKAGVGAAGWAHLRESPCWQWEPRAKPLEGRESWVTTHPTDTSLCPTGLCPEGPVPPLRALSTEGPSPCWGRRPDPPPQPRCPGGPWGRRGHPGAAPPRAGSTWARTPRSPCPSLCPWPPARPPSSDPPLPSSCPRLPSSCAEPRPRPGPTGTFITPHGFVVYIIVFVLKLLWEKLGLGAALGALPRGGRARAWRAGCHRGSRSLLLLGVVDGHVVVEHDQEEERDAQHVGEDGELHVRDHPAGTGTGRHTLVTGGGPAGPSGALQPSGTS